MLRKLTEFAECTGTSKAYRDTYLRTPKSGYTGKYPIYIWLYCFLLLDSQAKIRKISNISSSNDSGYNDKGEERSLQEITVRSCESLHGKLRIMLL